MFINRQRREINLKIVYDGPALSGKTTNLQILHDRTPAQHRSDLMSVKTAEDRTLFFDFLQVEMGTIMGMTPKFKLYTVPGQVYYKSSRRLILQGVDGVVFVADSTRERMKDNIQSWQGLLQQLQSYKIDVARFPIVIQANKQDLRTALPPEQVRRLLNGMSYPVIGSEAVNGTGVANTLKQIVQAVLMQNSNLLGQSSPPSNKK